MSISIYTSANEVYHKIARLFPGENISEDDVFEWCMDAEINYIKDGDLSAKFIGVPLTIDKTLNMGALPCNVIRVIEVYDKSEKNVEYQITAANHIKLKDKASEVYITYLGVSVDDNGIPAILSSHVNALVTFCKMQMLEPKLLMGKASPNLVMKYEQQFSGQITAIKQSATNKDKKHYDDVNIIQWNMIRKVGQGRLFKNMFR